MKIQGKTDVRLAALDIIAYEGIDKLTMSHLSEALGITKATLYHYYRSKEEILDDIHIEGHRALMSRGFRLSLEGSAEDILLSAGKIWLDLFSSEDTIPYLRMIFSLHLTDDRSQDEYRALSLMLKSQADVIVNAASRKKNQNRILSELFSSLLMSNLEKVLEEESIELEKDIKDFANLISDPTVT